MTKTIFKSTILYIGEKDQGQRFFLTLLKNCGIKVIEIKNLYEIVDKLKSINCSLILINVDTSADEKEIVNIIIDYEKQNKPNCPIIAVSESFNQQGKKRYEDAGIDDFISVSIEIQELHKFLKKYLEPIPEKSNGQHIHNAEKFTYNIDETAMEMEIRPESVKALIETFIEYSDEYISKIEEGVVAGNFNKICDEAHRLKGTSLSLRFKQLSSLAREMEQKAGNKEKADYKKILNLIKKEIKIIKKSFE